MLYQNYIFDLYGTLVDIRTDEESPLLWKRTALWYTEHGTAWTEKALRKAYLDACVKEQEKGGDPLYEFDLRRVFSGLFAEKGVAADDSLTEETARFFRITSTRKLRLYPWTRPLLARLRRAGAGVYLLSNAQACFTEAELLGLGLSEAFDGIVLSSDAGVRKPHPAILRKLMTEYQIPAEKTLLTGNDRLSDIAVAETCGLDSFYLETETSGKDVMKPQATYELLAGSPLKHPVFRTEEDL